MALTRGRIFQLIRTAGLWQLSAVRSFNVTEMDSRAGYLCMCIFITLNPVNVARGNVAYAVYDENSNDFVLVKHEPPRDKYVAGGNFTNSINQTGYMKD